MTTRSPIIASLLLVLILFCGACTKKPMLAPAFEVPMKDQAKIHQIVREALIGRSWTILKNQPNGFEAEYKKTPYVWARIQVRHVGSYITISLLDSAGLDHQPNNPAKGPMIHRTYNTWVNNLEQDIKRLVGARL